jgi:hypothetical protein
MEEANEPGGSSLGRKMTGRLQAASTAWPVVGGKTKKADTLYKCGFKKTKGESRGLRYGCLEVRLMAGTTGDLSTSEGVVEG